MSNVKSKKAILGIFLAPERCGKFLDRFYVLKTMENNYNIEFDYHFYFMGMVKIEFYVVSTRFFLPDQKILFLAEIF